MMEDGGEATDDRLQTASVLLDHVHHVHQPTCCVALGALDSSGEEGAIFLTHAVESGKHCLGVHHWKERTARTHVYVTVVTPRDRDA